MTYDVMVIGAGITGSFIARELSRYKLDICLCESGYDAATATSGANSGIIHAGYDTDPGSVRGRFDFQGNRLYPRLAKELNFKFKNTGSLVLAFDKRDEEVIRSLYYRGKKKGIEGLEILSGEEVKELEPAVSNRVKLALRAMTAGIVSPYEVTSAALENAVSNGVEVFFDHEVLGITESSGKTFDIETTGKRFSCRYIVNAAGLFADKAARMVGDDSFSIHPRKGEYLLLDKNYGSMVSEVIFQTPSDISKGVLVTPTAEGNLLLGPTADDIKDKNDFSTSLEGLGHVMERASISVPAVKNALIITSFAGSRAISSTNDFIISPSNSSERFLNVAGIGSPGLTAAPAIAVYAVDVLRQQGLCPEPDKSFDPIRKTFSRMADMGIAELDEAIKKDHRYAKVVCRCESVSEAEIVAALKSPLGSVTLDGIKKRTRAGMGRCQGGFCTPKVMEILSRELSIPMDEITKSGKGSEILSGRTK